MMEYFSDWQGPAVFYRTVSSKNAAGQTVTTEQQINAGATIQVGRWVDKSIQTNIQDKFALQEVGKLVIDYRTFFVRTTAGDPPITTDTVVLPDSTWYALINGVKYYIEGADNIGGQNEVYLFTYRKAR